MSTFLKWTLDRGLKEKEIEYSFVDLSSFEISVQVNFEL